jgi:glycosyltransferase involved in cell wall biosynthesis
VIEPTLPRVGVVIATYNYGRYIAAAVESVFAQTFRDLELIVVDDGSTDDSLKILGAYSADRRLRVIRLDHVGQSRAKNAGVAAARAPFIAFLDADDVWHAEKLQLQLALFDAKPELGVVYTRRTLIDEAGHDRPYRQPQLYRGNVLSHMFQENFVCFSSAMVRRTVLEHIGWFDPSADLAIDYDLWMRAASHYEFDYVDMPLVKYRLGHGNLSRRVGERLKTVLLIMRRYLLQRGGRERLDPAVMRRSLAETYCSLGFALRPFSTRQAGRWFLRAAAESPGYRPSWRALAGLCVPARLRSWLRSHDWDKAYRCPENDPKNV